MKWESKVPALLPQVFASRDLSQGKVETNTAFSSTYDQAPPPEEEPDLEIEPVPNPLFPVSSYSSLQGGLGVHLGGLGAGFYLPQLRGRADHSISTLHLGGRLLGGGRPPNPAALVPISATGGDQEASDS